MWTVVVLFVLATAGCWAQYYENEEGGLLARFCSDKEAVSQIKSTYVGSDRIWNIECKPFIALNTDCSWSGFISLNEKELNFNCKANHVITGVYSIYSPEQQDREWNFLCCSVDKLITFECRESPKLNYYNEDFNWLVPGDNYLTGARTHNNNNNGDHRWSYNYCRAILLDTQAVSSQILAANSPIANLLTQGDVAVPATRSARVCDNCRWTKSNDLVQVPYILSDSFSSSNKATIQNAINGLHLSTCVRFVPLNGHNNYVSIVKQEGCWSYVGRTGGSQQLSLGDGCLSDGIIQHELLHVLGFWHEQSRTDRDLYVQIHKDNVQDNQLQNFDKLDTYNLNVPYDYSSVMHYGPTDFSKNGLNTISALLSTANMGQRIGMSENDILKINKLYSCTDYLHKKGEWDNEVGETLSRQCPSGQAVSSITSFHNNNINDRLWGITCKAFEETKACFWSDFVNDFRTPINFKCADNKVISGVYSSYSSSLTDRKWKFLCCSAPDVSLFNCQDEPVTNYWDEYFHWKVASNNYLTGVTSSFDTQTQDRRWSFSYCQRKVQ
ncbi:uncharacterized protein LOC117759067 [Hippoglossus hippoglossus]|uniref:uncharacterized protein LOC117759067 n=1 Tax=Hippoglossus hippoglossus TaxID=8267 RepID=UPI00148BD798|nr:uncharacterized protein LOC117759067 [Hippoglossus hippoglossus]